MNDETKQPGQPVVLVYAGRRQGVKNPLLDHWFPVKDDGSLGEALNFKAERAMCIIGAMYKGARLEEKDGKRTVYGLKAVQYMNERWPDNVDVQRWHIETNEAETTVKLERLEKNADKSSPIERAMLPVRELYEEARKRGDWALCSAYEGAVLNALRKRPSSKEKSE